MKQMPSRELVPLKVAVGSTHVEELIDRTQRSVTPEEERDLASIIDEDAWLCSRPERRTLDAAHEGLNQARAAEHTARRAADEHRGHLSEREQAWRAAAEGSWLRAGVAYAAFLTCFAAEYAISLNTLPFVLDVDATSVVGMLLAAAPPAAMAVFDILLVELLEGPWRQVKDATRSWRRSVVWSVRATALLLVLAGNLQMLSAISPAREEAVRIKQALSAPAGVEGTMAVDHAVITRMVLYVSIWVSIDGALLLMFGHGDGRRIARRVMSRLAVVRSRRRQARLDGAVEHMAADVRTCERRVAAADEQVAHSREMVKLTHAVHLRRVMQERRQLPASHLDRVNSALGGDRRVPIRPQAMA